MHYSSVQAAALQLLNVGSDIATIVSLFRASVTASFAYNSTLALNSIMKICLLFQINQRLALHFIFSYFELASLSLSLSRLLSHKKSHYHSSSPSISICSKFCQKGFKPEANFLWLTLKKKIKRMFFMNSAAYLNSQKYFWEIHIIVYGVQSQRQITHTTDTRNLKNCKLGL